MLKRSVITLYVLLFTCTLFASTKVKIRLFADKLPVMAIFSVSQGAYDVTYNGGSFIATKGEPILLMKESGRLLLKNRLSDAVICDSVKFTSRDENDSFLLRIDGQLNSVQNYSGDLACFPDFGTILFINSSDIEKYIAGVVMAEGGTGRNIEYVKTQAIIARTYMYKYFDKHFTDKYNVCDITHCQAFNGLSNDSVLNKAVAETKGMVILDKDSVLIISAFSSNCGGETSSSEDVWLTHQPYLRRVKDPYCVSSRNAMWKKTYSRNDWVSYLKNFGFNEETGNSASFGFSQLTRLRYYSYGKFNVPLQTMRNDLKLRSTFFSVSSTADSVILKGRGYGHGVGLCQEGAMSMSLKGFDYKDIINYYYTGVIISDVKNAVALPGQ